MGLKIKGRKLKDLLEDIVLDSDSLTKVNFLTDY